MSRARKKLEEMGLGPQRARVEGQDAGPPYSVSLECAGDDGMRNATAWAKTTAQKYRMHLIPFGPNGWPELQGEFQTLDIVNQLAIEHGSNVISLEPREGGGTEAYLESHS